MKNLQPDPPSPPKSAKERIKSALFFVFYYSGVEWVLARLVRPKGVAVLMYHGVCDHAAIPDHINFHLEESVFERQMRALARRYPVVPLADVVTALVESKPLNKSIVLTFDDGYRNNARHAAPILQRLGLPYTIFVATAYMEAADWLPLNEIYWRWSLGELSTEQMAALRQRVRGCPWEEVREEIEALRQKPASAPRAGAEEGFAMLSWDEIRSLASNGADFGSHTHTHCNMAAESPSQQRTQLLTSKKALEDHLGRRIPLFTYPYGHEEHMSQSSRQSVIDAGFDCAISTNYGLITKQTDRFCLPRLGYDRRIWMFTGELLRAFVRQAARDLWLSITRRT